MRIEAKKYNIEATHDELWDLAFNVRTALYETFETHWINHQNGWKENEMKRLSLLREMFFALGRPDLFEEIEEKAEEIFTKFNKKRGSA